MNSSIRCVFVLAVLAFSPMSIAAQVISQPTPVPLVTADSESWYLRGDPITYAGNTYYPAGAQVSFNSNEMVRSGFHLGVPLYTRTTDEPYSVIYVPLARGFVQPYMRPRFGEMAGTAGTAPPAGAAAAYSPGGYTVPMHQAAGPPTLVAGAPSDDRGEPRRVLPAVPATETRPLAAPSAVTGESPAPAGTGGATAAALVQTHTRIGPPPKGINAVFVRFRERSWYGEGQPVPLDRSRMKQVGELGGFPVFVDREAPDERIYVATTKGGSTVAPYAAERRQEER